MLLQTDRRGHRRRATDTTASNTTSTASTTTTTATATASTGSLTEAIPWPTEAAATTTVTTTAAVCQWRVGRSCHNARWLFLRFAHACNYSLLSVCVSLCLPVCVQGAA